MKVGVEPHLTDALEVVAAVRPDPDPGRIILT